ncbi:hypothetical protein EYF80_020969 [Liparis tanakae]|uniref:Uncharacterized protein n=1 Tax=Liparis tanakae TaxID=230148 RepID=A0A4Z2HTA9_9TELE|nr:hypothetical protein EYF80_020969 [Liparis tanakae]
MFCPSLGCHIFSTSIISTCSCHTAWHFIPNMGQAEEEKEEEEEEEDKGRRHVTSSYSRIQLRYFLLMAELTALGEERKADALHRFDTFSPTYTLSCGSLKLCAAAGVAEVPGDRRKIITLYF